MKLDAYWRLMRFHKPAGSLLLWVPTAWALWLANKGQPDWLLVGYFLLGTLCMRAAGCIVNDMADRNFDRHVQRTKHRPLTAGEIQLREAFFLLIILLLMALWVLMQLPLACFKYALLALAVTGIYPFCKRFLHAPQLVLGIAFSMGIPLAYAASQVPFDKLFFALFILNFLWIVAYDTMYAMADKEDDLKIGIQSTAIWFASYDRLIIFFLQCSVQLVWLVVAWSIQASPLFYGCWLVGCLVFAYQQYLIYNRQPANCLRAFSNNILYGLVMWAGVLSF